MNECNNAQCAQSSDIRCNMCGQTVEKDHFGYLHDYVSLKKLWGYHSPYDGEGHTMNICTPCYEAWTKSFEIPLKSVPERLFM